MQYRYPHVAWWLAADLDCEYSLSADAGLKDLTIMGEANGLNKLDEYLHQLTHAPTYAAQGKPADPVRQAPSYV